MSTSSNAAKVTQNGLPRMSLYVGELHPDTTEANLHEVFSAITDVDSVHLCRCDLTGKSLGYAYVNFYEHSDVFSAMACLNYTELKGKPMKILWSLSDPFLRECGVGNLLIDHFNSDSSVTSRCLLGLFSRFGTVISLKVAEKEEGEGEGFGVISFESDKSAVAASTALHDTDFLQKKLNVIHWMNWCTFSYFSNS